MAKICKQCGGMYGDADVAGVKCICPDGPTPDRSLSTNESEPKPTHWDSMSETEKVEYATNNWPDLSAAQRQEYRWINADRRLKRREQMQARKRQQSPEHQRFVREQLDKQHAEQKTHVRISDRSVHGPRRCVDCGRLAMPHSERCYTCESD